MNIDNELDILIEGVIRDKIHSYVSNVKKKIAAKKAEIKKANKERCERMYRNAILRLPIDIEGDMDYLAGECIENAVKEDINDLEDIGWLAEHTSLMYACLKCKHLLRPDELEAVIKAKKIFDQKLPKAESNIRRAARINEYNTNVANLYKYFMIFKKRKDTYGVDNEVGYIKHILGNRDKEE